METHSPKQDDPERTEYRRRIAIPPMRVFSSHVPSADRMRPVARASRHCCGVVRAGLDPVSIMKAPRREIGASLWVMSVATRPIIETSHNETIVEIGVSKERRKITEK